MMDTTSKYNSILQQHNMHPLSTTIPHPSITLQQQQQQQQHSTRNSTSHLQQDFSSSPIDFANNEALFMSPLGRNSHMDDFEDLDYQSGLASYQKQHMAPRHPSMTSSNSMDIHLNTTTTTSSSSPSAAAATAQSSNTIPIHPIKQETSISSSFYTNNGDYGDMSALPMSAPANIGHFGASSPPSLHYLGGDGDNTLGNMPMPTTTTSSSSSLFIHPQEQQHHHHQQQQLQLQQQQQQQNYQYPQQMDSPGSTARSFEDDDYSLQVNMQIMMDKRRRRRESHNAVERRRRENINERIQELGTLLPEMMAETNVNNKPNKGAILRHSVDHIRHLQQEVQTYSNRVNELEATLAKLQSKQ